MVGIQIGQVLIGESTQDTHYSYGLDKTQMRKSQNVCLLIYTLFILNALYLKLLKNSKGHRVRPHET